MFTSLELNNVGLCLQNLKWFGFHYESKIEIIQVSSEKIFQDHTDVVKKDFSLICK